MRNRIVFFILACIALASTDISAYSVEKPDAAIQSSDAISDSTGSSSQQYSQLPPDLKLPDPSFFFADPNIGIKAPEPKALKPHPYFRTDEQRWWLTLAKNRQLNLADTNVIYPKFIQFCVNVYNWADHFFNGYDPEYVVGTGKRWKARVLSDNWLDSYWMTLLDDNRTDIAIASHLYTNIGAYLQYMAVSVGYSYDVGKFFGGGGSTAHRKLDFGFNCARFNVEVAYHENTGGSFLRKFGKYKGGKLFREFFPGLSLYNFGIEACYFLNNKRYSHGAAYNFSKFQKKSQGSWIIGFAYTNQKINFDFSTLPDGLLPYFRNLDATYYFHYQSYVAIGGYGYNWVIHPNLLFNITVLPAIGVTHCYEDSDDGAKYMFGANFGAKMSLTYNLGNFFFGIIGKTNTSLYHTPSYSLFSSIHNFSGNIGFRF